MGKYGSFNGSLWVVHVDGMNGPMDQWIMVSLSLSLLSLSLSSPISYLLPSSSFHSCHPIGHDGLDKSNLIFFNCIFKIKNNKALFLLIFNSFYKVSYAFVSFQLFLGERSPPLVASISSFSVSSDSIDVGC
jgi:hypothetical protein